MKDEFSAYAAWSMLSQAKIAEIVAETFTNVSALPNEYLIAELRRKGGFCSLELMENRTGSAVYRIKQTGQVFQIKAADPSLFYSFGSYEEYLREEPFDTLIVKIDRKEPVHTAFEVEGGDLLISRQTSPRFTARFRPPTGEIEVVEWIDEASPDKQAALLKKAAAFGNSYRRR